MKTIDTTVLAGYNAGIERNRLRTGIGLIEFERTKEMQSEFDYLDGVVKLFKANGAKCYVVELCADFENYMKIDNTHLSPEKVAEMIKIHFEIGKSN